MRFAVDWDGTCREDSWPATGAWMPGAVEALRELTNLGHVIIHTCRIAPVERHDHSKLRDPIFVRSEIDTIRRELDAEGLHGVEIWTRDFKPPADYYIDNKGVHYNGRKGAWPAIVTRIKLKAGLELEGE